MDRLRFGIYDFSPSTGELRRDGTAVRLQAQPARVLAALLQRPGELVTRETLQAEVWGAGVTYRRSADFREAFTTETRLYVSRRDDAQARERFLAWAEGEPSALSRPWVRIVLRLWTAAILICTAAATAPHSS